VFLFFKKMMHKLIAALLVSASVLLQGPAYCAWENIRYSEAPLAVVRASTGTANGTYEVSYTVGEACAGPREMSVSPDSVWSGYLSLVPANIVNQGLAGFESNSAVAMDGALWGQAPAESVKLLFSEELSPALSSPGLTVTRVYDSTGSEVNVNWPVTLSYSGQKLVILPSTDWPKGSVFSVSYSGDIVDINGSPVSPAATVYFSVIMDYQADNTAAAFADRRVRVSIPANAYSQDFYITLSTDAGLPEVTAANAKLATLPGSPEFVNTVRVRPYDSAGNPVQPNSACVVSLPYPGAMDAAGSRLKSSNLAVWHLDEQRGNWVKQTGAVLDTNTKLVSQPVSHFSNYALLALPDTDVNPVYAFPVPFRPNGGNPARYGTWAQGITFTNLPISGKIKIYTISGALVRELPVTPPSLVWDVKNKDGQTVASGVYLWEITTGGNRKTGKLVVIK
jgi:hypothetical protein